MATTDTAGGSTAAVSGDSALLRKLGFWALAAAVINMTVGGGIFALPGTLAETVGAAAPLSLLLGALVFVPIALCFSAAGSRVYATGGPYSYIATAFGPMPGFVGAAVTWISNVAASGGISAALTDHAAHVWPVFAQPLPRTALLVGIYAVLCLLNARGVSMGARAIMLFAVAKLLPLVLLATVGLMYIQPGSLHVAALPSVTAFGSSMVLVIFAYSGLETALMPSGEISDPSRTLPKATLAAIAFVVLLYVGLQVVAQGVLGPQLSGNTAPLAAAAGAIVPAFYGWLLLTASVSLFGVLQGDLLGSSRLLYALGRDGYLPSPLARITTGSRVPLVAVIAHSAVACGLAVGGNFGGLALLSGGAICLVYIGCCAAAWRLQHRDQRGSGDPFVLRGGPLIPLIACVGLVLVLTTLQPPEWKAIGYALLAVIALYALERWMRRGKALPEHE